MLEKINQKNAPKEVVNALISLYENGELEQILAKYSNLTKIYRNSSEINIIFGAIHYKLDRLEKSINETQRKKIMAANCHESGFKYSRRSFRRSLHASWRGSSKV